MKLIQLTDSCYYFNSAVNVGYIRKGDQGMLVDAGIDQSSMNKVLRQLSEKNLPLTHLFITHAHADHYGGAAQLQKKKQVYTIVPYFEEAVLRYPKFEPLYLFQGNNPPQEMRNKFLEGKPLAIDEVVIEGQRTVDGFELEFFLLPGHSDYQLAVKADGILYAADSYFSKEQLDKHKIPFLIDAGETIESLERVKEISCSGAVPGHGEYEEDYCSTVDYNIDYHHRVLESVKAIISESDEGCSHETLVSKVCGAWGVNVTQLSQWTLFRTAVTAYMKKCVDDGFARMEIQDHKLFIIPN